MSLPRIRDGELLADRLIVFTRYPRPGHTKTRLVPRLGAEQAANLHARMTEHIAATASHFADQETAAVEVCHEGGGTDQMKQWLGEGFAYTSQVEGDLGRRMACAFQRAFEEGTSRVVLVGSDIPGITTDLLAEAFSAVPQAGLVLGPAKDGGYYLIGIDRSVADTAIESLFNDIAWGTDRVLAETLFRANQAGLAPVLLRELADIDRPEDLPEGWLEGDGLGAISDGMFSNGCVSVIIPTLNEAGNIARSVTSARRGKNVEVIAVDGGSHDETVAIVNRLGIEVVESAAGRANQMNAGARAARGEYLLFLHADTLLPESYDDTVRHILSEPKTVAGAFRLKLDRRSPGLLLVETFANFRSQWFQMPYGDQAIFVRNDLFRLVGGYAELPIMEDYELVSRLKGKGQVVTAPTSVVTSARRWNDIGILRTTLNNQMIIIAYHLGCSPSTIARLNRRKPKPAYGKH